MKITIVALKNGKIVHTHEFRFTLNGYLKNCGSINAYAHKTVMREIIENGIQYDNMTEEHQLL